MCSVHENRHPDSPAEETNEESSEKSTLRRLPFTARRVGFSHS